MSQMLDLQALKEKARSLRLDILDVTTHAASGHPSSSFSSVEILTALYFGHILRYRSDEPHWPERDRFIMSKGHAAQPGSHAGHGGRIRQAHRQGSLPVGLAPGAEVVQPVPAGEIVTWDDVKLDENSIVVRLRRQQDELI